MRALSAALLLLFITSAWAVPFLDILSYGWLLCAGYASVILLLAPVGLSLGLLCIGGALVAFLVFTNDIKIDRTHLPLTFTDLRISFDNPAGLAEAMGLPHVAVALIKGALILIAIALVGLMLRGWRRRQAAEKPQLPLVTLVALFGVLSISATLFTVEASHEFGRAANADPNFWNPDGVTQFSRRIGLVPFLLATRWLDSEARAAFVDSSSDGINKADMALARQFIRPTTIDKDKLPNIVLIQAESTFDPNTAFHLAEPYANTILVHDSMTVAMGPLKIIPIGGGSWVSEFEAVTGLDSRLFGYFGYYTHASVSPYVKGGFARYLRSKGYQTYVFYSWPGEFFNARSAYGHYGFNTFLDSHDLGRGDGGGETDLQMVDDFVARMKTDRANPFFAFIPTSENHAPHECLHFKPGDTMIATLAGTDSFGINCQLNEYMLRMRDTAVAFDRARDFLADLQRETGRPFVIALYGDHQPHTFTGTDTAKFDFTPYRTKESVQHTVFKIDSSLPNVLDIPTPLPLSLMPTLLSAFVAGDADDLYLPANLALFAACGEDFFKGASSYETAVSESPFSDTESKSCSDMRARAVGAYRKAGAF
ncbi:hypothetical protein C3941_04995 [Kaistia algarum]|uniref:sulfatase-like hydrolase/transferase n=1 Tax=Kaistia algarum TaxID=2083279 RepID=UPI000CE7ABD9|nr:sulfatase-like hydrolase/transferase [Kaistia algarum]MCX5515962.1 sulfatase-like hydrolase/transferase [Kaistia algarum]PPE80677.1 hypothetical protein C3941_04995 [Kaistia algarum]